MGINEADVAELVDARDLKSLVESGYVIDLTTELATNFAIDGAEEPAKPASKPTNLQNNSGAQIRVNKVSARGKRYAYIRGTDIALVRGFTGSDEAFDSAIDRAIADHVYQINSDRMGWRLDAARSVHKAACARAQRRGWRYDLDVNAIAKMLGDANDCCVLTGLPFDYRGKEAASVWMRRPMAPSLDRIDNACGYELDNIRIVCTAINIAINEWGLANFDKVCRGYLQNILEGAQP